MVADRPSDHQATRILDGLADLFATRNLTNAGVTGAVGEDREVAREERAMRSAQVEQHAVAPGNGDDPEVGDLRGGHGILRRSVVEMTLGFDVSAHFSGSASMLMPRWCAHGDRIVKHEVGC